MLGAIVGNKFYLVVVLTCGYHIPLLPTIWSLAWKHLALIGRRNLTVVFLKQLLDRKKEKEQATPIMRVTIPILFTLNIFLSIYNTCIASTDIFRLIVKLQNGSKLIAHYQQKKSRTSLRTKIKANHSHHPCLINLRTKFLMVSIMIQMAGNSQETGG